MLIEYKKEFKDLEISDSLTNLNGVMMGHVPASNWWE